MPTVEQRRQKPCRSVDLYSARLSRLGPLVRFPFASPALRTRPDKLNYFAKGALASVTLLHRSLTVGTCYGRRHNGPRRWMTHGRALVPACNESQERRNGGIAQFRIYRRRDAMKLPELPGFESDFKDAALRIVGKAVHLCIHNAEALSLYWRNKMNAVFDVLPALSAKHHGRETSATLIPYKCTVFKQLCPQRILN